jgi:hypothetical protein
VLLYIAVRYFPNPYRCSIAEYDMIHDREEPLPIGNDPIQVPANFDGHIFRGPVANLNTGTIGGKGKRFDKYPYLPFSNAFLAKLRMMVKPPGAVRRRDRSSSPRGAPNGSRHRGREQRRQAYTMYSPQGTETATNTWVASGRGQTLGRAPQNWSSTGSGDQREGRR